MNKNLVMHGYTANIFALSAIGITCLAIPVKPAAAQPPQVQNYLGMAPDEKRVFVGGAGAKVGHSLFGTTWGDSTTLTPPLAVINYISQSPLHKKILLLQRIDPVGFNPGSSTTTAVSTTAKTQGSFKVLVLCRTPVGQTRPTGKSKMLLNLTSSATGYAKINGSDGTSYYPPNIPTGRSYSHVLRAWIGAEPDPSATVPATATMTELKTIDWDTATLVQGESDIYSVEIQSSQLGAQSVAQYTNIIGYPTANVSIAVTPDTREVKLTRGGRYETSTLINGEWHTYGDSIYSAYNTGTTTIGINSPIEITAQRSGSWDNSLHVSGAWSTPGIIPTPYKTPTLMVGNAITGTPTVYSVNLLNKDYEGSASTAQTFDITHTLTDTDDGAKAKSYYHLTLHDPVQRATGDTYSLYHVLSPMLKANGAIIRYSGPITNSNKEDVTVGTSTEYGQSLTATATISFGQKLLDFGLGGQLEGEVNYKSKVEITTQTKKTTPLLAANEHVFLMADHPFQRRHVRFWMYDNAGKIRRMVTQDSLGATFNPPIEAYHEAIEDTSSSPTFDWSAIFNSLTTNWNIPPSTTKPAPIKDFSGDVS